MYNSIENIDRKYINNNKPSSENKIENSDKSENEYNSYCDKCDLHLDMDIRNYHKEHEHRIIFFDKLKMNDDIRIIKDILLNDEKTTKKFKAMNKNDSLREIIKIIIKDYEECPNIILIKNIKHIIKFFKINIDSISLLEEYINNTKSNVIIDNGENNYETTRLEDLRIIEFKGGLNNKIYNELFSDALKNNLGNLIELDLLYNNINDIGPLLKVDLRKLEVLNLAYNKLSDEMIPKIKELQLPELKKLYLASNNFTNYDIFKALQNFKNLENFNIKSNRFIYNRDKNKYKNISLNTIKEMNLGNGVFNDDSIDLLFQFGLKELEIVNLFGNYMNLSSFKKILSFISKSWNNLKELNLMNNNIIGDIKNDEILTAINEIMKNMQYYNINNDLIIDLRNNELKDINKIIVSKLTISKRNIIIN